MKKCIIIVCKYFGKVKPGDKLRDVSFVGNKNNSPNNGVVSPNVVSNIVDSFGNQAPKDNDNTSDNTGSSPNNGLVSPNIDYDPGTSSHEHGIEAAKNRPDVAGCSPNSNLFSPITNEGLKHLVIYQAFKVVNEEACIVCNSPKNKGYSPKN